MAPSLKDLQLSQVVAAGRKSPAIVAGGDDSRDLEDVRLLDAYEASEAVEQGMKRIQVGVTGMTCAACSNSVEAALKSVNGVITASVALLQNKADVLFDPRLVKVGNSWGGFACEFFKIEFIALDYGCFCFLRFVY